MSISRDPIPSQDCEKHLRNATTRVICLVMLAILSRSLTAAQTPARQASQQSPPAAQAGAASPQAAAAETTANPPAKAENVTPQQTEMQKRKAQLAADTAELLKLANELKAEMDKSTKDELSLTVVKKADQVEKLAHKVRDEMKLTMGN